MIWQFNTLEPHTLLHSFYAKTVLLSFSVKTGGMQILRSDSNSLFLTSGSEQYQNEIYFTGGGEYLGFHISVNCITAEPEKGFSRLPDNQAG